MIGKIIGAGLGARISKETGKVGGVGGAMLGALAVPMVRRLGVPAMIALAGGGYLVKRLIDKRRQPTSQPSARTAAT